MVTSVGDSTNGAMISAGDGVSGYGEGVDSMGAAQAIIKERRKRKKIVCFIISLEMELYPKYSTIVASPCPTPTQRVARPYFTLPRKRISWTSVVTNRAPEH